MEITPRMLRAFLAVAEAEGFTAAAGRAGMVQSVLSELVAALEQALGVSLFARTTRRVALTPAGRAFRPRAAALLADLAAAREAARQEQAAEARATSIATTPLLAGALLPQALVRFHAALPGGSARLTEASAAAIPEMVRAGQVLLGLGTFSAGALVGLHQERLATDHLAVFLPLRHPLARRRQLSWQEIGAEPWISLDGGSALSGLAMAGRVAAGLPEHPPVQTVSQIATALALVDAGLGIAILPQAASLLPRRHKATMRQLIQPVLSRDILVVRRPGTDDAASRALADALRAGASPPNPHRGAPPLGSPPGDNISWT
ncbi:LysR family transcriptional regulator [Rhodovarius crocodyli]|uniref:LysR family transcriptional regulator n=1 Tax=Rhodovarius crocodyli TaxID=1979269 RepID=A0A437LYY0_9PROT|nr:LysR family transcriptional regulator [Rhodovarius crocodyli]RVT90628.1 LysR family transcriptional regulator [Rhodovarius crocodyli]